MKFLTNIFLGITAYAESFRLLKELKLWKYFLVPMLISFFTAISIGLIAWLLSDNIGAFIAKIWFWEWGSDVFRTISEILAALIVISIGIILYKHIVMALSAPFMSPVSEKIEAYLLNNSYTPSKTSNAEQLWRGIRINVRNLGMELFLTIPIIIISFIPIVNLFTSALLFLVQAYYAGFGNMDYTLERHFKVKDSIVFVKKHRGIAVGNGLVFMAMLLIPVVGIILVLPLSVTASTVKTVQLLKEEGYINEFKNLKELD